MSPEELRQVVVTAGLNCRINRAEVVLEVCTYCGNEKYNLEMSAEKGVFHCWACKRGGRLDALLQTLTGQSHHIPVRRDTGERTTKPLAPVAAGEFRHQAIKEVESAARYLERRGITPDVAAQYGMVVCVEPQHRLQGRIAIPCKDFWTGEVVGWVGRSYTGKTPKYLSTLQRKVITGWRHRNPTTPAVVVEGPLDGITAHRAGFQAAVLSGVGGSGVMEWAARLAPQTEVAILLDGDAVQQAHQLFWEISPVRSSRVVVVSLPNPEADPASLGVAGVQQVVRQALSIPSHTI